MLRTETERVLLRVDLDDESEVRVYIFESLERLERVLAMIGLPAPRDHEEQGESVEASPQRLSDLLEYSEGLHVCEVESCQCARHNAA